MFGILVHLNVSSFRACDTSTRCHPLTASLCTTLKIRATHVCQCLIMSTYTSVRTDAHVVKHRIGRGDDFATLIESTNSTLEKHGMTVAVQSLPLSVYYDLIAPTSRYRTIMSYSCGSGYGNYFSNPDVSYLGRVTGTATEDNARTIEENKVTGCVASRPAVQRCT